MSTRDAQWRWMALIGFVFFSSGFISLTYQVVWQRLLTLVYGVGPVSTTVIVSAYMLGLGLGSAIGALLSERTRNRILAYFLIELGISLFGLGSLPLVEAMSSAFAGTDHLTAMALVFAYLCLPTTLMGMTLPMVTRLVAERGVRFIEALSWLYFINTLGAAAGALLSSYLLITALGLDRALIVAAVANLGVMALILVALLRRPEAAPSPPSSTARPPGESLGWVAYLALFLAGFIAIGLELVWMRVLSLMLKSSPYAFSTVLAVYLAGIALGSYAVHLAHRRRLLTLGVKTFVAMQAGIGAYVALSFTGFAALCSSSDGFRKLMATSFSLTVHPSLFRGSEMTTRWEQLWGIVDIFLWPAALILVPTCLMGGIFPVLANLTRGHSGARGTGLAAGLSAASSISGNVLGGLVTGFVFLEVLGTERTILVLCLGCWVFVGFLRNISLFLRLSIIAALLLSGWFVGPRLGSLYRQVHEAALGEEVESAVFEGHDAVVVTVFDTIEQGRRMRLYINGMSHGGRPSNWFVSHALQAKALAGPVRRGLVIGAGTLSSLEALLLSPEVEELTLVEINPTVIEALRAAPDTAAVLRDPRVRIVVDDGRRMLNREPDMYELIVTDPLRATTAYSNNLYSTEFLRHLRSRLSPDGVLLLYMSHERRILSSCLSVFPEVRVYRNWIIASQRPFTDDARRLAALLSRAESHFGRSISAPRLAADGRAAEDMAGAAPPLTDYRPRAEFFLRDALATFVRRHIEPLQGLGPAGPGVARQAEIPPSN